MKALKPALALWPLALVVVSACGSSDGASVSSDGQTGAVSAPIIGGRLDTTTKGVVALGLAAHNQVAVTCTGSLLAPNLVLTARHCVSQIGDGSTPQVNCATTRFTANYDPREMFVSTASEPQATSKLYAIKEVRVPPGSSTKVCGNDIAMLILSGSGVPSSEAKPLEPVLDHPPTAKQSFAAVGYGLQDPNDEQGTTAGTRMRFDQSSVYCIGAKCPSEAGAEDDEWVGDSPVCSGDSGGPALDANGRVFGVTSRGDDQCTFALYSNVADWADFVRSTASAAATSGGYTPPSWAADGTSTAGTGGSGGRGGTGGVGGIGGSGGSIGGGNARGGAAGGNATGGNATGGSAAGSAGTTAPPPVPVGPTVVDPLGMACSGDCPGTYQCYSASGTPPGICVPSCSAAANSCPARYTCSETLKVCTPTQSTVKTAQVSGTCALSPGPKSTSGSSAFTALLGLGVLWFGRRRRHAR